MILNKKMKYRPIIDFLLLLPCPFATYQTIAIRNSFSGKHAARKGHRTKINCPVYQTPTSSSYSVLIVLFYFILLWQPR